MNLGLHQANVCPVDDAAEPLVVGVVVPPDDVPTDHAGLLLVGGVVGAVEREVPQRVASRPGYRPGQVVSLEIVSADAREPGDGPGGGAVAAPEAPGQAAVAGRGYCAA